MAGQETTPVVLLYTPPLLMVPIVRPAGRCSIGITPVAASVPLLLKPAVMVSDEPAASEVAEAEAVATTSEVAEVAEAATAVAGATLVATLAAALPLFGS